MLMFVDWDGLREYYTCHLFDEVGAVWLFYIDQEPVTDISLTVPNGEHVEDI